MGRRIGLGLLLLTVLSLGTLHAAGLGRFGRHEGPGEIQPTPRPAPAARPAAGEKQILFGDLHVHTTFSLDAFVASLPVQSGEGAHPPADACDFARFCSALDFWSINDHAEGLTPEHWRETVESLRACNAVARDAADPDTVAFLGWEWTQIGATPADHYGHKNVVLRGLEDDEIPTRPVAAGGRALAARARFPAAPLRGLVALTSGQARTHDLMRYVSELSAEERCDPERHARELPPGCLDVAETPADLFRRLDEWGVESLVIPHGTSWGLYTPPGSTWDGQLAASQHDPKRQRLIEIYSGHGDAELWRGWKELDFDADGEPVCPAPRADYLPTCWRAGEILRERCLAAGEGEAPCEARATETRALAAAAGGQAHLVVDGATLADWRDAGQCRDCREPTFNHRPGGAAQYILSLANFDEDEPERFRFGFIASSDNHSARPGTGYKERFRRGFTESNGEPAAGPLASLLRREPLPPSPTPRPFDRATTELSGFQLFETERQTSFFLTGGLVGVHARGRDRASIWSALERREVYGTSGPRILLWFELEKPGGATVPMGGAARLSEAPVFHARAVGSFEQLPGCPDTVREILPLDRLERLCKGECYHPSDRRRRIARIEAVRIRPQAEPGEPVAGRIDDPWQSFACEPDAAGCVADFSDADFVGAARDTVYYVRAFEEPAPAINAGNLRCERDERSECVKLAPCPGPDGAADDCLAPHEPRAWSSPIYVDFAAGS